MLASLAAFDFEKLAEFREFFVDLPSPMCSRQPYIEFDITIGHGVAANGRFQKNLFHR
jgi:hypothetical protein